MNTNLGTYSMEYMSLEDDEPSINVKLAATRCATLYSHNNASYPGLHSPKDGSKGVDGWAVVNRYLGLYSYNYGCYHNLQLYFIANRRYLFNGITDSQLTAFSIPNLELMCEIITQVLIQKCTKMAIK